ncbi:hypothetical protein BSV1_X11 (plasmid) [Borreliella finlandensis]|uniref:Uncharacterized protein n=1 Tax=Borreliella finlandensis TaxID=498741 RepID=A0A806C7R3_9SPIR|nr:hypothetical protein BSV1_X11 [Borreliella finlandensis]
MLLKKLIKILYLKKLSKYRKDRKLNINMKIKMKLNILAYYKST